jgi:RHS repeat-associated protein
MSTGGRYDYKFDKFDRLTAAEYTAGESASADEDFSTAYEYDAVANPISIRRYGVINNDGDKETFGLIDNLTLSYSGNHVKSVTQRGEGVQFYGRVGYGVGETEDEAVTYSYGWNANGSLTSDESRSISSITYNHLGQPLVMTFADGTQLSYIYNSGGQHVRSDRYIVASIGKNGRIIRKLASKRHYVDEFVFDGDTLTYSNFSGGYFDRDHKVHYIHSDYQGSTIMVTDSVGNIEQHTAYYPYGEPQREPTGQPWLFSGKERERTASLRDYDFSARRYFAPICSWLAPDRRATQYTDISPFAYCASNPIRYIDPTGNELQLSGKESALHKFIDALSKALANTATVNLENNQVTIEIKPDADKASFEEQQEAELYRKIISDEATTLINVVESSADVIIGDCNTGTIDIDDIVALGEGDVATSEGALVHEVKEQYEIQVKGTSTNAAHARAIGAENLLYNVAHDTDSSPENKDADHRIYDVKGSTTLRYINVKARNLSNGNIIRAKIYFEKGKVTKVER